MSKDGEAASEKPRLATFALKKGKAYARPQPGSARKPEKKTTRTSPQRKKSSHKKDKERKKEKGPRGVSRTAPRREENSPFAVLKDMKVNADKN